VVISCPQTIEYPISVLFADIFNDLERVPFKNIAHSSGNGRGCRNIPKKSDILIDILADFLKILTQTRSVHLAMGTR
jgi:hypothetical protein